MMRYAYRVFCIGLFGIMGSLYGEVSQTAKLYFQNRSDQLVEIKQMPNLTNSVTLRPHDIVSIGVISGEATYAVVINKRLVAEVRCAYDGIGGVHDVFMTDKTKTAKNDGGYVGGRINTVCLHYPTFKIKADPTLSETKPFSLVQERYFRIEILSESVGC